MFLDVHVRSRIQIAKFLQCANHISSVYLVSYMAQFAVNFDVSILMHETAVVNWKFVIGVDP